MSTDAMILSQSRKTLCLFVNIFIFRSDDQLARTLRRKQRQHTMIFDRHHRPIQWFSPKVRKTYIRLLKFVFLGPSINWLNRSDEKKGLIVLLIKLFTNCS